MLVHFVNGNPGRDLSRLNGNDLWVDEIPSVGPYTCRLRCSRKPASVQWMPGPRAARTQWNAGVLTVAVPRFRIHQCLVVG